MKTLLIIGATGMLGMPVAQKLKDRFLVRLLVRDLHRAQGLLGEGFEYVVGDVFQPDTLLHALDGVDGAHINLSGDMELDGVKAIVHAAKASTLSRLTFLSGSNVSASTLWFALEKRKFEAEQTLIKSGIPYTIFRATWFMETLPKYVQGDRAAMFGDNPKPFHFIAADDYANSVLAAFEKKAAANKIFFIHGPKPYRFKDALTMYVNALHPEITKVSTVPYFLGNLIGTLTGNKKLKEVVALMKFFEKEGERGDPREANELLGAPKLTLEDWMAGQKT